MRAADAVVKTVVLVPAALLLASVLDLGGLRAPVSRAVVVSAEAVAQPVADELLERLPWPGPRRVTPPTCVFGPYAVDQPCAARGQRAT